ncbi:MAG TPA: helix-turn-helix transcriptional regulator [Chitinophagaceae bacterium]|nr:helix-turn-helix transcriptional regulator [Chitinophagaceae bacterium]
MNYICLAMNDIPVNSLPKGDHELKVIPLGHLTPYDFRKPHRHAYFEFFLFEKGGGNHFIDFVEYTIPDHSVHIVFPQQVHQVNREPGSTGFIILCSRNVMNILGKFFFPQLLQNNYTAPSLTFGKEDFARLKQTVLSLQEELRSDTILSYNMAQSYTSIFLTHCIRHRAAVLQDELPGLSYNRHDWEVYKGFVDLLEQNFMDKAQVSFYAASLASTPKVLNNSIRKVSGKTAVELLQERSLLEAQRLLLNGEESIKEIAYKLGFQNNSYFTRFFVKHTGHTPSAFKQLWEEKYNS